MNIEREDVAELNSLIRIKLTPADYEQQVESAIKKFQKSAKMPGFRPGHVPQGMIKKMYGKSFLAEELNKIVSNSLHEFLKEQKISVLGDPLPRDNEGHANDFETPKDFEFLFEVGIAPVIDLNFSAIPAVPFYEIEVDEERINTYVDDLRRKHGKFSNPEQSDEKSILYGDLVELNADGTEKEGGIRSTTTVAIDMVKDATAKAKLIGLKKDDEVVMNPMKDMQNATEVAYMLRIEKSAAEELTSDFRYKILSVNEVDKIDVGQELFDKAFGEGNITTEEDFRNRVKADIAAMFNAESVRKFNHDAEDAILHALHISLPDDFLKRWILSMNEKPITTEQLDREYPMYAREMKWKMIENKIAAEYAVKVEQVDLNQYAASVIMQQFGQYNIPEDMIGDFAKRYLEKEENLQKAHEAVKSKKVFDLLNQNVAKDVKVVGYDAFVKIVQEHHHHD